MKQLSPAANTAMRCAIAASGACNLAFAGFNAGALDTSLPGLPWAFLTLQIGNAVVVAGLSFVCVWMMGE